MAATSMNENVNRKGNFTSSNAYRLMGTDKVRDTYIKHIKWARKLGRSLNLDVSTRTLNWGIFMEHRVFDLLEFGYELQSQTTKKHETIPFWSGSPDLINLPKKIADIKCYEPLNFAEYADALLDKDLDVIKKVYAQEYWQLVSNACLFNVPNVEAILYMPYKSELNTIREMAENYDGDDQWKYKFIVDSPDSALPYLPDDSFYPNLVRFEFEVPEEDKKALTANIIAAGKEIALADKILEGKRLLRKK